MSKNTQQAGGETNRQALRFVNLSCYEKGEAHPSVNASQGTYFNTMGFSVK